MSQDSQEESTLPKPTPVAKKAPRKHPRKSLKKAAFASKKAMVKKAYEEDDEKLSRRKSKKKKQVPEFVTYIYRVLKQVHSELGISNKAMKQLNDVTLDIFEMFATKACYLCRKNRTKTITSREFIAAASLILKPNLAKHAIIEGNKHVEMYNSYETKGRGKGKGKNKYGLSRSRRAGLEFSVGKMGSMLKEGRYADRVGLSATITLASILEYLVAEILELAGTIAQNQQMTRVTPRHVMLAMKND
ncbi:unnamed protein product, partial [marine sediment metagenome]